jgi:hypothetical protein
VSEEFKRLEVVKDSSDIVEKYVMLNTASSYHKYDEEWFDHAVIYINAVYDQGV